MDDTKIFSKSAVGRITSGANPNKAIKARYPLAPPCPTEAYKKATSISNTPKSRLKSGSMNRRFSVRLEQVNGYRFAFQILGFIFFQYD